MRLAGIAAGLALAVGGVLGWLVEVHRPFGTDWQHREINRLHTREAACMTQHGRWQT